VILLSLTPKDIEKHELLRDLQNGKIKWKVKSMLDALADDDPRWLRLQPNILKMLDTDGDGKVSFKELLVGVIFHVAGIGLGSLIMYLITQYGGPWFT
jgi:hypothetical protein